MNSEISIKRWNSIIINLIWNYHLICLLSFSETMMKFSSIIVNLNHNRTRDAAKDLFRLVKRYNAKEMIVPGLVLRVTR